MLSGPGAARFAGCNFPAAGAPPLWLVRHPAIPQAAGLCYGRLDWTLPDAVVDSAAHALMRDLQRLIPAAALFRVWSSPLQRCRALAEALHAAAGVQFRAPIMDPLLQEMHFAAWEGLTWDAIARSEIDAWALDPWQFAPGGGETAAAVLGRWRSFEQRRRSEQVWLSGINGSGVNTSAVLGVQAGVDVMATNGSVADAASGSVVDVVVTHAGVIRMALFDAGQVPENALWLHSIPYVQPIPVLNVPDATAHATAPSV